MGIGVSRSGVLPERRCTLRWQKVSFFGYLTILKDGAFTVGSYLSHRTPREVELRSLDMADCALGRSDMEGEGWVCETLQIKNPSLAFLHGWGYEVDATLINESTLPEFSVKSQHIDSEKAEHATPELFKLRLVKVT